MTCINCGATLRSGARFCNTCGMRQPTADEGAPTGSANTPPDAFAPPSGPLADANTRLKRPPRPVRGGSVPGAPATGILAPLDMPDTEDVTAESPAMRRPVGVGSANTTPIAQLSAERGASGLLTPPVMPAFASPFNSSPQGEDALSDEDTAEYNTVLPGSSSSQAPSPSAGAGRSGGGKDPLPWPLPASMIVGGRYRIEEVLSSDGTGAEAVNVYRVVDLQGYEKCWACGAGYSPDEKNRQFCDNCGADMLARDYRMTERRQVSGATADEADTQSEDASAYLAQIERLRAEADASGSAQHPDARVFTQGARLYRVTPKAEPAPLAFPFGAHVSAAGASDVGQSRAGSANEDSFGVFALNIAHESYIQPLSLCLVADGLGGHANGQDASRLATRVIMEYIISHIGLPFTAPRGSAPPPDEGMAVVLREAVQAANAAIYEANQQAGADMGSTLVAALISGETAWIVNLGDSRCYVFDPAKDEIVRRITVDHSLVEQLIVSGLVKPEDRYTHPNRNQIFRSLGADPKVEADLFIQQLQPGMRLLLCCDGLWEMTRDDELTQILRETPDP
ncbi:MAG TPA: protein phosphatase 2C domain-containing protein, partial [Ktedonobacterales bacterium]|nr:protein phosphatase 2C domain-containing protein [Ktedonobacterales bacterium]